MKWMGCCLFLLMGMVSNAQLGDHVYKDNIHAVKLFVRGNIYAYPVLNLNSADQLELHFDDFDADVKNYYYTFLLCNADWTPSNLPGFDYISGFQTTRITQYRYSSISEIKYTQYQAAVPERNSAPTRSGNYILKVFLNSDTTKLLFTKRFLVVDNKVQIAAQVKQPYNGQWFLTHQRIQVSVNTQNAKINILSPNDIKLVTVQNYNWRTAVASARPTIFRGNYFEYSDDAITFPGQREWRWLDMRSVRLRSDRMAKIEDHLANRVDVFIKPDVDQRNQVYFFYSDINGMYTLENTDGNNPYWQSDYAYTHFTYVPPGKQAIPGKDIYINGELTNYAEDTSSMMQFNADLGVYEKTLLLKQGYYNYSYVAKDGMKDPKPGVENVEGDYWGTENTYMVLIYFRPFGARADELVGYAQLNSVIQR